MINLAGRNSKTLCKENGIESNIKKWVTYSKKYQK